MTEFFRDWRRNIGVITLMVALLGMGGWVRGLWAVDMFFYQSDWQTLHALYSSPAGFGWTALHERTPNRAFGGLSVGMCSLEMMTAAGHSNWIHPFDWKHTDPSSQWSGIYAGTMYAESPRSLVEERTWIVRYPSIVIPLTLVSFCLLVRIRQKSTVEKIMKPGSTRQRSTTPPALVN